MKVKKRNGFYRTSDTLICASIDLNANKAVCIIPNLK